MPDVFVWESGFVMPGLAVDSFFFAVDLTLLFESFYYRVAMPPSSYALDGAIDLAFELHRVVVVHCSG